MPAWLAWQQGCKRELLIWHRRSGKDDVQLHKTAVAAHQRVGNYWHCLPKYEQARKAIWEAVNPMTSKRRIDEAFPPEIRRRTDNGAMVVEFLNGSIWRLVGSDDPNSLVGAPPVGLCFSEWALSNPEAWAYLAPILLENGGWASFITTSRGRNHAFTMLNKVARPNAWSPTNPAGWFSQVLAVTDTGFPLELVEHQRHEYHGIYGIDAGDALIDQEFYCSFDAAVLGAYYGKQIARSEAEGRITQVAYDPKLPVHAAWDIGLGANLAVLVFQVAADRPRIIYGLRGSHDDTIPDMVARLRQLPVGWDKFSDDWMPHDARVREHGTKRTRVELMTDLGRRPRLVPAHKIDDGINAGRMTFDKALWDRDNCAEALEHLRMYRALWDSDRKVFKDKPDHDYTSHYSDAYRYLAMAWRAVRAEIAPKPEGRTIYQMTLNELWEFHEMDLPRESRI